MSHWDHISDHQRHSDQFCPPLNRILTSPCLHLKEFWPIQTVPQGILSNPACFWPILPTPKVFINNPIQSYKTFDLWLLTKNSDYSSLLLNDCNQIIPVSKGILTKPSRKNADLVLQVPMEFWHFTTAQWNSNQFCLVLKELPILTSPKGALTNPFQFCRSSRRSSPK